MECNYLFCTKITESRRNNYMQIWIRDTERTFVVFAVNYNVTTKTNMESWAVDWTVKDVHLEF